MKNLFGTAVLACAVSLVVSGCGEGFVADPAAGENGDQWEGPAVEVEGEFRMVVYDDFESGASWTELRVELEDGEISYRLEGLDPDRLPGGLTPGATIRVTGRAVTPEVIEVDTRPGPDFPMVRGIEVLSPTIRSVSASGERSTLVIVANFTDATVPCTNASLADDMFGAVDSVDGLYRETSLGKVGFTGVVVGPYTISASSTSTCDGMGWGSKAEKAAKQAGIKTNTYDHIVTVLPSRNTCGYVGVANVYGPRSAILNCVYTDAFAHELGHNLGLRHAGTVGNEYGDRSDFMGYATLMLRQVNAPHKVEMGWIAPSQVIDVTASGVFDLAPLELDQTSAGGRPQVLRIPKRDTNENWFLSYRQPIGYDVSLNSTYTQGASLHHHSGSGPTTLWGMFSDGRVWNDFVNSIMVTQLAHDADGVTVQVDLVPDTQPPSDPQNLKAASKKAPRNTLVASLSWTQSTDNVGVVGYDVSRDGTIIGNSTSPSFSDENVSKNATYTYAVRARDAAGNASGWSTGSTVTIK